MTTKEMRKLDAWLAEHVMKWNECVNPLAAKFPCFIRFGHIVVFHRTAIEAIEFKPTLDAAQAMEVLEKCLEKRLEFRHAPLEVWKTPSAFVVASNNAYGDGVMLPLAICEFARDFYEFLSGSKSTLP